MNSKKMRGAGFTPSKKTDNKPDSLLEQGKKRKRECLNRTRNQESLEAIKEYVHEDSTNQRYPY
jgi:hypothetical protein